MRSAFLGRAHARRVTTCTALALSAGMLLASPAVAESGPRPVVKQQHTGDTTTPKLDMTQPAVESGTARAAAAAAVVAPRFDVNGDGKTDLIHRKWNGWTYVAPSNGAAATVFETPESRVNFDLVPLGDQNGTGKPELLSVAEDGVVRLYTESTTTKGSLTWSGKGWTIYNKVFSPGDISGDGKADLLAREYNGDLYYYRATGVTTAPFAGRVKIGPGWGVYDQLVGIGDNSGDGRGDVVARTTDGRLYFYGSTGNPTAPFKPRRELGRGWNAYNQLVAPDDRNGDGKADLLARDQAGALWAYSGLGNGSYSTRVKLTGSWNNVDQFAQGGSLPTAGKNGFLGRDKEGTLFSYRVQNNGKISAREQASTTGGWAGASISYVSALDWGTLADILEVYQGRLYNNGNTDLGGGWQIYNLIVGPGDLTGDGKGDLVARDRSGVLYLYPGNGQGTAVASRIRVGDGWSTYNKVLGAGDFSGDGRTDLLARDGSGTLWLYRGTGSATAPFAKRVNLGGGWGTYNKLAAPGDLNGDGKADLLAVNAAGDLYRYLGTGTSATLTPRARIGYGFQTYDSLY
ncbi:FG-GAP repeat domain-containing protein [Streptomyces gardneri]|uniref:FG-GAP repeat domain-containing protein n=1 Tax=Streptomyces gardneri TaxID=66892 RepID=UPI0006BDBCC4|nr:VCBS repeat-containing protein [Streptomyces gardneri]WRK37473.1 VCBS repeat-containing protein [Streptomyces venezuelae]CUM40660.1 N-acetylmuramoyl-L-alanine amidase [Streptomyces venezuelae]